MDKNSDLFTHFEKYNFWNTERERERETNIEHLFVLISSVTHCLSTL